MSETVSVVMPAYNAGKFLSSSVDSILAQTYRDWELIIVDDGSADETSEVLSKYVDSRIRVIRNESNSGIVFSLNRGIHAAAGAYVARMDADDMAFPNRLETQVRILKERELDLVSSAAITSNVFPRRYIGMALNSDELKLCLHFFNPVIHPLVLGRREVFLSNPYSKNSEYGEDYELWCRIVSAGFRAETTDDVLLKYRVHAGQISLQKREKQINVRNDVSDIFFRDQNQEAGFSLEPRDAVSALMRIEIVARNLVNAAAIRPFVLDRLAIELILEQKVEARSENLRRIYGAFGMRPPTRMTLVNKLLARTGANPSTFTARAINRLFR
jgi:glycosyltransferase involved in cell wall biosynthesis